MTTTTRPSFDQSTKGSWAYGISMFAGVMLLTLGILQALQGIAAIGNDKIYIDGVNYVYSFDVTTWGWVHLGIGVLAVLIGVGVVLGHTWGRIMGLVIAVFSVMSSFMFIPHYPIWSIVVIAFDIAVIWALSALLTHE